VFAGCLWHTVRRGCAIGLVLAAHAAGRLREMARPSPVPDGARRTLRPIVMAAPDARGPRDFLSGTSGGVWGIRATTRALLADGAADLLAVASRRSSRLARAAARAPSRRVLVLGVERADAPNLLGEATAELRRSHHDVDIAVTVTGGRGKFENLNRLLEAHPVEGFDWLLILDDDVTLPRGFLDTLVFLAERFGLRLAQPAHRHRSHAAWPVTRRRALSVVRETAFVEIGPVVALHRDTFPVLLPFPPLRFGWGLDAHWSAVARDHGWPIGVIDAVAVRHGLRRIAAAYDREDAIAEGGRFLAGRPYTPAPAAGRTLATHRSW
jgi:hypothetical protein